MKAFLLACFLSASSEAADFSTFGGSGDGATNNVSAWSYAITSLCNSTNDRVLNISAGKFMFYGQPAAITCALKIEGQGQAATVLIREYPSTSGFIKWAGGGDALGGAGGSIRDLSLDAGHYAGGSGLWVQAQAETNPAVSSKNPHGLLIDNVFAVAGHFYPTAGSWAYGFNIDGTQNASPPAGVAPGIRFLRLLNSGASQFSVLPILFDTAFGTRILGFDCFVAVGTGTYGMWVQNDANSTWGYATCPLMRP